MKMKIKEPLFNMFTIIPFLGSTLKKNNIDSLTNFPPVR